MLFLHKRMALTINMISAKEELRVLNSHLIYILDKILSNMYIKAYIVLILYFSTKIYISSS